MVGTSRFEKADASMGVVFGDLDIQIDGFGYNFFKQYLSNKGIGFDDYPSDQLISSRTILELRAINPDGLELEFLGNQITLMEDVECTITLEGIPSEQYATEFPHHLE